MKKIVKSRTARILFTFSVFAIAALPVFAHANSDESNLANSTMGPAAIVGSVALIIGLVILLAAKGSGRVSHQK